MTQFYWFDGQAPQGPFEIKELLAKPGFGPESIICPVGARESEDWRPASSYEPFFYKPLPEAPSEPEEPSSHSGLIIAVVVVASVCAALFWLYFRRSHAPVPAPEKPPINLPPPAHAKRPARPGTPIPIQE